jgi:tripartite-type tricarboxylate transporter receptor subunit TctC
MLTAYIKDRAGFSRISSATTAPERNDSVAIIRYEASGWFGIGAPKNTPAEIIETLNKEINAALADSKIKGRFADLGGIPLSMIPADFRKFITDETEKWGKVIRAAGINAE